MRLTILFDAPYWIGLLEVERDGCPCAAWHIFGAEPSDADVFEFVQRDLLTVQARMTVGVPIEQRTRELHSNPKRVQRKIRQQMAEQEIPGKAQEAMRLQIEQNKHESVQVSREQREALRRYKREIVRKKAKARHKGR